MGKKALNQVLVTGLISMASLWRPLNAFAIDIPSFPTCSNPQSPLKISYVDGKHGIVGNPGEFIGSDSVYTVNDVQTLQCFCAVNGDGIQTNWWKATSLTQEEIQTMKNLGWTFVPDGSVWGLANTPYIAQNTNYSCGSNNSSSNGTGGAVLSSAASTQTGAVLGFAATGNASMLLTLAITSILSLVLGIVARKRGV